MLINVVYWLTSSKHGISCSDVTTTEAAVNILHNIFAVKNLNGFKTNLPANLFTVTTKVLICCTSVVYIVRTQSDKVSNWLNMAQHHELRAFMTNPFDAGQW